MMATEKPAVLVFTTAYHPYIGGAEIAIEHVARRLASEYRFFIITARMNRDLAPMQFREEGVIVRVGLGTRYDKFLLPFWGTIKVLGMMRRTKPAFFWPVMVNWSGLIPYFINTLRFWDHIPVFQTLQEGDSEAHIRHGRFGMTGFAWRFALRRADEVQAISSYLGDFSRQFGYRGRVRVIPNGIDFSVFQNPMSVEDREALKKRLGIASDARVIVTTSRLVEKNAIDVLIRAFARMHRESGASPSALVIVGDGHERERLVTLARTLGVAERVQFVGSVPNADIPRYLAIADIYCRPSRSEGLGVSFLEAMAAGVPVVATAVGGITDFLRDGENGIAAKVDDYQDLAAKLSRLLGDGLLRQRLGAAGRETVKKFYQWDAIAESFRTAFVPLVKQRAAARVLLATPFVPPALGGPATYAWRLAQEMAAAGRWVTVLSYRPQGAIPYSEGFHLRTVSMRLPPGLRQGMYFLKALWHLRLADAVIALDPVGVGVPVAAAARLWRRPLILRIEGDRLWESYIERTGTDLTLPKFSEHITVFEFTRKERLIRRMTRRTFTQARQFVCSSAWRQKTLAAGYGIAPARIAIISPPVPAGGTGAEAREPVLLFAGRFVRVKNLSRLVRVFAKKAPRSMRLELIGEGPERHALNIAIRAAGAEDRIRVLPSLGRQELAARIAAVAAVALPSLSDVSPNLVLECIAAGTPVLLTRETGFAEWIGDLAVLVDPLDEAMIAAGIAAVASPRHRAELSARIAAFPGKSGWPEVARRWLDNIDRVQA
ncbi:glycosyltransferase [Candidatus Parcubacteria bacterium]|nr:MAG: glycosyltransferase [Candidatus Parcubacteria bacterium]